MIVKECLCTGCVEFFEYKDLYWVYKENHYDSYCMNCIEKRGYTRYEPMVKPRKKKEKDETKENKTTKKKTVKKKT